MALICCALMTAAVGRRLQHWLPSVWLPAACAAARCISLHPHVYFPLWSVCDATTAARTPEPHVPMSTSSSAALQFMGRSQPAYISTSHTHIITGSLRPSHTAAAKVHFVGQGWYSAAIPLPNDVCTPWATIGTMKCNGVVPGTDYALSPTQLTCSSVEPQYFSWRCVWRSAVALVFAFTASGMHTLPLVKVCCMYVCGPWREKQPVQP